MFKCAEGHQTKPQVMRLLVPVAVRPVKYLDHRKEQIGHGYETVREEFRCPEHVTTVVTTVGSVVPKIVVEPVPKVKFESSF